VDVIIDAGVAGVVSRTRVVEGPMLQTLQDNPQGEAFLPSSEALRHILLFSIIGRNRDLGSAKKGHVHLVRSLFDQPRPAAMKARKMLSRHTYRCLAREDSPHRSGVVLGKKIFGDPI
jgi:hypothetical protein